MYPCLYFGSRKRKQPVVFEHSSDRFLPVGRTSCLECTARTDWPAWQDDLTAGCCKELTVGYEWLALLSYLFLKLVAALMKLDHFILHVGQVAFSEVPSLNLAFVQQHKEQLEGTQSERKWLVRAAIFFCLKDAGVSCFGFAVMLYLPLQVLEFPISNVTH